jgi:hypothetical protein
MDANTWSGRFVKAGYEPVWIAAAVESEESAARREIESDAAAAVSDGWKLEELVRGDHTEGSAAFPDPEPKPARRRPRR